MGELRLRYPRLGIIAITGRSPAYPADFLPLAQRLGADAGLGKPFDIDVLLEMIPKLLEQKKASAIRCDAYSHVEEPSVMQAIGA
jgi:hypothetical protein